MFFNRHLLDLNHLPTERSVNVRFFLVPTKKHESFRIFSFHQNSGFLPIFKNTQQSGNIWVRYSTSSEVVRKKYHLALLQIFDLQGGQWSVPCL